MKVGTMFFGEVEALDHESVQTKFFVLGVPLFPLESYYATSSDGHSLRGVVIDVHPTSVLAGYLRIGAGLAAFLCGLFAWFEWRAHDPQWGLALTAGAAAVVWAWSLLWLGRLSPAEQARRRRLRAATGIGAPPELLTAGVRADLAASLERRWAEVTGGADWRARLKSGEATSAELLVLWALAEYDRDAELATFADEFLRSTAAPTPDSDLFSGLAG